MNDEIKLGVIAPGLTCEHLHGSALEESTGECGIFAADVLGISANFEAAWEGLS